MQILDLEKLDMQIILIQSISAQGFVYSNQLSMGRLSLCIPKGIALSLLSRHIMMKLPPIQSKYY